MEHEHRAHEHERHERQRPRVAHQRHEGIAASRHAFGHGSAAKEEEPCDADHQPDAPQFRGHLPDSREQRADARYDDEHDEHHRGRREQRAKQAADAATEFFHGRQEPCERAADGGTKERHHRQHEHRKPQMAVVIQRQIAVARIAVCRQVQQKQPADSGGDDEPRVAQSRRKRLRHRDLRLAQPRGECEKHARGHEERDHETGRHRVPARVEASCFERSIVCERPRHATRPRGGSPDGERERNTDGGRQPRAAQLHQDKAREHPRTPLPARGGEQVAHGRVLGADQRGAGRRGNAGVDRAGGRGIVRALTRLRLQIRFRRLDAFRGFFEGACDPSPCCNEGRRRRSGCDGPGIGEATIPSGFIDAQPGEPGKDHGDCRYGQNGFGQRRPRDEPTRRAGARVTDAVERRH